MPRCDDLISNSSVVLSLSNKDLPVKNQGSLESILLLVTSLECGSTENRRFYIYACREINNYPGPSR